MKRRHILALPLLAAAPPLARPALAQAWPTRSVRIVVPYPAGQGTDIFGRRFAEYYQRRFGHPFVVENRAGAGGNIGSVVVARAEPDGYTLLWGTNATHAANEFMFASLGFDPVADFAPIAAILNLGMLLYTNQESPIRSLTDLIAAARARPGQVSIGVPSTTSRVAAEILRRAAGVEIQQVPYNGSAQALTGALRGDVIAVVDTIASSLGTLQGGRIRPLGVSLGRRSGSLPDVPTFREQGIDAEVTAWNAFFAPKGTPVEIVRALNEASNAALADPALRAGVIAAGAEPLGGTPEDLVTLMRVDRAKWQPVIESLGLRAS
ncbi:tripartite tricarboxylate transporter substrate binding protein [Roseomonas eburnea]|uniref:Tripartite tricarboxylate transporter substrate binding protein n=1 Tax=Neoroseomonas eburnea TaxID=1346889 RepID=A0A9X9XB53_9PROT|nr:tripartite tricarboxylate transporter substrate binding protein [Neoroseomonas eburnea]MBR0680939.1 tripartite tricarboxylate transporter substrate binding protein [Neoroseomonas eburnea]